MQSAIHTATQIKDENHVNVTQMIEDIKREGRNRTLQYCAAQGKIVADTARTYGGDYDQLSLRALPISYRYVGYDRSPEYAARYTTGSVKAPHMISRASAEHTGQCGYVAAERRVVFEVPYWR